ncbi:MAG: porin [Marinobacter sp.]|nr:porin [Marinobacter sp.]
MRKSLLASAVAATMMAPMAQAITLMETEESKVSMYGRIVLQVVTTDETSEIEDNGSRIGFNISHKIGNDMTAYGRAEFRFKADERTTNNVFSDLRNTFVGVKGNFGDVRVGNFDSVYYSLVTSVFDVPEQSGYVTLDSGSRQSRGDTIAYMNSFGGLKVAVQAKHQPKDEAAGDSQKVSIAAAASYTMDIFTFGVGVNQDKEGMGSGNEVIGASLSVQAMDNLSVYGLFETQDENKDVMALGATFGYGKGDVYTQVAVENFDADGVDDRISYMLGANYKFSRKFYVFGEVFDTDEDGDNWEVTVGARLNF